MKEFLKIITIIFISFLIIYIVTSFKVKTNIIEGLTNSGENTISPSSGEAGTSTSYAAAIKALVVKLQDELLISKYRKDYESVIINLDDYIGYLMIKQTLNINLNGDIKAIIETMNNLNILQNSKDALNTTMAFLDKQ